MSETNENQEATINHDFRLRLQVFIAFKEIFENPIPELADQDLKDFLNIFETYVSINPNDHMKKGLDLVRSFFSKDRSEEEDSVWDAIEYDFNRLFIGPGRLLAAPYQSIYFNKGNDRTTMSSITEAVRDFYLSEKLEIKNLNQEPDDHIKFELEFISFLLAKCTSSDPVKPWESESYEKFKQFKRDHLLKWGFSWSQDIYRNAQSDLFKGIGFLFYGFLEEEGKEIRKEGDVFYPEF